LCLVHKKHFILFSNEAQNAIDDAINVLYFMVQNNLPLDLFSSLVDLIVELGGLVEETGVPGENHRPAATL
jgi:hypothetical protein